jgi:ASF1 like histone chaperone
VKNIPQNDVVGVTGILLTCSYNGQEFFRVGYYVNNYYEDQELNENPPLEPIIEKLTRHILVEKPRVTKFQIQWEDEAALMHQEMMNNLNGMQQQEGILEAGSQFKDRNDMMSTANLAQAAQNFWPQ